LVVTREWSRGVRLAPGRRRSPARISRDAPNFDSIHDEPEFKAIVADIERDMARQRAELEQRPQER
jgi:hypothetical protein